MSVDTGSITYMTITDRIAAVLDGREGISSPDLARTLGVTEDDLTTADHHVVAVDQHGRWWLSPNAPLDETPDTTDWFDLADIAHLLGDETTAQARSRTTDNWIQRAKIVLTEGWNAAGAWSTGERLAVAVLLRDNDTLASINGYDRADAIERLGPSIHARSRTAAETVWNRAAAQLHTTGP